jgi:hypothetical protein
MCCPILGNMANPALLRTGMVTLLLVLVSRKTTVFFGVKQFPYVGFP